MIGRWRLRLKKSLPVKTLDQRTCATDVRVNLCRTKSNRFCLRGKQLHNTLQEKSYSDLNWFVACKNLFGLETNDTRNEEKSPTSQNKWTGLEDWFFFLINKRNLGRYVCTRVYPQTFFVFVLFGNTNWTTDTWATIGHIVSLKSHIRRSTVEKNL